MHHLPPRKGLILKTETEAHFPWNDMKLNGYRGPHIGRDSAEPSHILIGVSHSTREEMQPSHGRFLKYPFQVQRP